MNETIRLLLQRCRETTEPVAITEKELEKLNTAFTALDENDPAVRNLKRYLLGRLILKTE